MGQFFNPEELLETGKSFVKKTSDQVVKQVNTTASATTSQVAGAQGTNEAQNAGGGGSSNDDNTKDFIKDLYGVSNNNPQAGAAGASNLNQGQQPQTPDDAKRLADARKLLMEQHMSTYYKPTFERVEQEEENVADKLEKEKQDEEAKKMEELQKEQKKKMPINVSNAHKTEKNPGASG